jgi:hypothetical protein
MKKFLFATASRFFAPHNLDRIVSELIDFQTILAAHADAKMAEAIRHRADIAAFQVAHDAALSEMQRADRIASRITDLIA